MTAWRSVFEQCFPGLQYLQTALDRSAAYTLAKNPTFSRVLWPNMAQKSAAEKKGSLGRGRSGTSAQSFVLCFLSSEVIFSCKSHRNLFQKLPLQCRHFLENPFAKNPKTQLLKKMHPQNVQTMHLSALLNFFNSVQTRCIVKGETQKSPPFWRFSGGFDFLRIACSWNSTRKSLNLVKSPIFTNTPCKSTCLYNAPSMPAVDLCRLAKLVARTVSLPIFTFLLFSSFSFSFFVPFFPCFLSVFFVSVLFVFFRVFRSFRFFFLFLPFLRVPICFSVCFCLFSVSFCFFPFSSCFSCFLPLNFFVLEKWGDTVRETPFAIPLAKAARVGVLLSESRKGRQQTGLKANAY